MIVCAVCLSVEFMTRDSVCVFPLLTLCWFIVSCTQTTLARNVFKELGGEKNAVYLTHDHYYKDQSSKPAEERAKVNFDHPDSLETDLLVEHLRQLKAGNPVSLPTYDFKTHSRTPITTYVHPKPIIIVEGILVLAHEDLCKEMDLKVFVVSNSVGDGLVATMRKLSF